MTFSQPFADYEILARVGSGAMGTVFKARQKKLDRIVALKVLKPALARDLHYVERLRREARIVAALNHPNIVAGHDLGQEGGYHYFVMEFVDGRSLKELLREWGSFPEEQVLDVAVQVAHALDHAWQKGVIHRDIKPGNILIDQRGRVKLTDMGLAKGPEDLTLTREGATVGTPQYISPEQARDPQNVDIRSDLYSLGATLFHMATGSPPFQAESTGQLISKLLYERAPSAAALNPAVSSGMSLVIRKLLAKDPTLRYQNPGELLQDLGRVQRQEPLPINVDALERADRGAEPRRRVPWLWMAAGTLLVAAAGYAVLRPPGTKPQSDARAQLSSQLEDKLREAKGRLAGWRVLERAEAAQTEPALVQHVRTLREGFEASWRGEIDALLQELHGGMRTFLAEPSEWRDVTRYFPAVVEPALRERFGVAPAELPSTVRRHYEGRLQQQRYDLDRLADERDAEHETACGKHLTEDLAEVLANHLRPGTSADYRAALVAIGAVVDGWHGEAGRPARHELPDRLRERCAALEREAAEAARKRVLEEEAATLRELERETDESLGALRARLATDDPVHVQKALERLERDLAAHYPPGGAFQIGSDPWPAVLRKVREVQREVVAAVAQAERQIVDADLVACYVALLATGNPERELTWLDHRTVTAAATKARLGEHRARIGEALAAARRLLETALAGKAATTLPSPRHPGGLRVESSAPTPIVTRSATGKVGGEPLRVPYAELPFAEWRDGLAQEVARALAPAERAAFERGLAVWLVAVGAGPRGLELVPETERAFYVSEVATATQAALASLAKTERPDLVEAWSRLKTLFGEGDCERVQTALAEFEARHAGAALGASYQQGLREIRSWVAVQRKAMQVRKDLALAIPRPSTLEVLDDHTLHVGARAADLLSGRAAEAFVLADDQEAVARPAEGGEAGVAWRRLGLPFEVPNTELQRVAAVVRFPEQAAFPKVVALSLQGASALVQPLQNGALAVALVPSAALGRPELVQKAFQRPLEDALLAPRAYVVPGAAHELALRVRPGPRGALVAVLTFDGAVVREEAIQRPPGTAAVEGPELRATAGLAVVTCSASGRW